MRVSDEQIEALLGRWLRIGVIVAALVVALGGVVYLVRHGGEAIELREFHGEPAEFTSPLGVVGALFEGRARALIQLGVLLLIATPVLRVAFSALAFGLQRDRLYVALTVFVLAVLGYSLFVET